MLRRTDLQRDDGRTLNIVDEIEIEELEARTQLEEEEKKDVTFDTFKENFTAHIEGTAPNEREAHESQGEDNDDGKKSARKSQSSRLKSKKGGGSRSNSQINAD